MFQAEFKNARMLQPKKKKYQIVDFKLIRRILKKTVAMNGKHLQYKC